MRASNTTQIKHKITQITHTVTEKKLQNETVSGLNDAQYWRLEGLWVCPGIPQIL